MGLSSNAKRASLREQCREALKAHIHDRLGLTIAPSQIRLRPAVEDGYAWSVTEANAWMLRSNLSNGTVGLYRAICDALGQSLEAVSPQVLQEPRSNRDASAGEEAGEQVHCRDNENESFTETIHRLEHESRDLGAELDRTRGHLEDVSSERRQYQAKIRHFQEELDRSQSLASQLRIELADVRAGTLEAMQVLQKYQHHQRERLREANASPRT